MILVALGFKHPESQYLFIFSNDLIKNLRLVEAGEEAGYTTRVIANIAPAASHTLLADFLASMPTNIESLLHQLALKSAMVFDDSMELLSENNVQELSVQKIVLEARLNQIPDSAFRLKQAALWQYIWVCFSISRKIFMDKNKGNENTAKEVEKAEATFKEIQEAAEQLTSEDIKDVITAMHRSMCEQKEDK